MTAPKLGTAEDFFFRVFRNLFAVSDTVLLHRRFTLRRARHSSAAQLVSLEITDSTYEDKLYLIDRFAGAFRHNAQKNWAALSCRPLRGLNLMCSRTVSDTANR